MRLIKISLIFIVFGRAKSEECGKQLKSSGEKLNENSLPWLVALIFSPKDQFLCGGSLIRKKHIISGECEVHFEIFLIGIDHNQKKMQDPPSIFKHVSFFDYSRILL